MAGSADGWENLQGLVATIVAEASALKEKRTDDHAARVSYSAVFCRDESEYAKFRAECDAQGALADDTPTGPVFVVPPVETVAGPLRVVKIRKPDSTRTERGDADFALHDYEAFKRQYLEQPGFRLIEREEFEMIELMDDAYDVRVYFSHPPVEEHSGIREALARQSG